MTGHGTQLLFRELHICNVRAWLDETASFIVGSPVLVGRVALVIDNVEVAAALKERYPALMLSGSVRDSVSRP